MNLEYPRNENQKYYTDKYLIHILSNQLFYERIFSSIDKALQYFNQCKDYFFVFDLPFYHIKKRYSGKDIKILVNTNLNLITKINKIDQLFFFIYKNRFFYKKIFDSIEKAKTNYKNVTQYAISVEPPSDFYDRTKYIKLNYELKELLEIYEVAVKGKKNNNFPIPIFWNKKNNM